ncbi:MAG: pyruvate dehydrogenase complex dihydrolipoamide acetyltransferase [Rickettsiaceae bacterium]|nr:pyruvate dehydrogenase complex dihydrolipoamide acetyltransferase [Rickettsiaceae bacterium]
MPIEILMPALSPTMEVGNLTKWLKNEGDSIKIGDVLAEIETDKATMELESIEEGVLGKIFVPSGSQGVKVRDLIAVILTKGEDASILANYKSTQSSSVANAKIESNSDPITPKNTEENKIEINAAAALDVNNRKFATPLARRMAQQANLDISSIAGSGPNGRVIKFDITNALETNKFTPSTNSNNVEVGAIVKKPHSGMRKIIAARLSESKQTVPHFYLTKECNLDKLIQLRQEVNHNIESKISINDFIIKACAIALKRIPEVNASWTNDAMVMYNNVDVSVAVSIDEGLVTPIIRGADKKSVAEISQEMKKLAEKARSGKLIPTDYQGGGFTISNMGMYGIKNFSAIINPPQSCILAVGTAEKRAIVDDSDNIKIANILSVTLSCDHRVVDGTLGAKWLKEFTDILENPLRLLL